MRKLLYLLLTAIVSCQNPMETSKNENSPKVLRTIISQNSVERNGLDSIAAKEWLQKTIIQYFDGTNPNMESITTEQYYEFKMDAMNVDLGIENSLSQNEFNKKWKDQFNLELHPIQVGFLISGQDWGNIQVAEMRVKDINSEKQIITFKTRIQDLDFNVEYDRDIILIKKDNQYRIMDVLEYD